MENEDETDMARQQRRPSVKIWKALVALNLVFLVYMWVDPFLLWTRLFQSPKPIETFLPSKSRARVHSFAHESIRNRNNLHAHESIRNGDNYIPTAPTLVIGGMDGSGTRAIAKTMESLGVVMKLDDPNTFDVHASARSPSWIPIVQQVLKETHSANYEIGDLSNATNSRLSSMLRHLFWTSLKQHGLSRARQPSLNTTGVFVGVKAPATMLLLPLLQEAIGPIKFIHVVRDGRDISLSENQTPVTNFYSYMFPNDTISMNGTDPNPVLSMRLWNAWNTQVLQWEQSHSNNSNNNTTSDFEYLVVRTEDFVHPNTRLETLVRLAAFVESPISIPELCKMSQRKVHDFGRSISWTHDTKPKKVDHGNALNERYGKWKRLLKDKPELSLKLHKVGAEGLAAFGYQPPTERLLSLSSQSSLLHNGSDSRLECHTVTSYK